MSTSSPIKLYHPETGVEVWMYPDDNGGWSAPDVSNISAEEGEALTRGADVESLLRLIAEICKHHLVEQGKST